MYGHSYISGTGQSPWRLSCFCTSLKPLDSMHLSIYDTCTWFLNTGKQYRQTTIYTYIQEAARKTGRDPVQRFRVRKRAHEFGIIVTPCDGGNNSFASVRDEIVPYDATSTPSRSCYKHVRDGLSCYTASHCPPPLSANSSAASTEQKAYTCVHSESQRSNMCQRRTPAAAVVTSQA